MVDPGFLPGTIGVLLQTLFSIIIHLIENGANCLKEFDELKDRLHTIQSIYRGIKLIYAERIDSLPSPVHMWLTKLNDLLQQGSHFLRECKVPSRWDIISSFRLTKKISRITLLLDKHLTSTSLVALHHQFHEAVANRESFEQMRQANRESFEQIRQAIDSVERKISPSAGAPADLSPSTSSAQDSSFTRLWENDVAHSDSGCRLRLSFDDLADIPEHGITLQLCFLYLAVFLEAQVITTANATKHWIKEELLTGRGCGTGQGYVNLLADSGLIEPLSKDDNRDVRLFKMPDDFQNLAHQIAEEEKRIFRTGGDSREFSNIERLNASLEVRIKRGTNLAVRDWRSSDPYVVVGLGDQKRETGVVRKNLNPVWNEELSLPVLQPQPLLLKLEVFDKDRLSRDDPMGDGEVDLNNLARAARTLRTSQPPSLATMNTEGSRIECVDGQMVQKVCLKLQNVESGELYLNIKWVEPQDSFPHF